MESDSNGIGTGRNKIKITIGRGDLGAKYECRAKNDALDEPLVSWVELDVNGKNFYFIINTYNDNDNDNSFDVNVG